MTPVKSSEVGNPAERESCYTHTHTSSQGLTIFVCACVGVGVGGAGFQSGYNFSEAVIKS